MFKKFTKFNSSHKIYPPPPFFFLIWRHNIFLWKSSKILLLPPWVMYTKKAGFKFKCLDLWLQLILVCILCSFQIFSSQNANWNNMPNVTPVIFRLGLSSAEISAYSGAAPVQVHWMAIAPWSPVAQLLLPAWVLLVLGQVCTIVCWWFWFCSWLHNSLLHSLGLKWACVRQ